MRFLQLWERRSMSINLNYVAWKKPEVINIGCVWSFFRLEEFKIILLVLKYLLAYLGSSVKTTIVWPRCACDSSNIFQTKTNQGRLGHLIAVPSCILFGKPPYQFFLHFFFKTLFNTYRFEIVFVRPRVSVSFLKADMYIFFLTSQLTINNSEIIPPPKWLFVVWIKLSYPALVVRPRSCLLTCPGKHFQKITFSVTVFIG